MTVKIINGDCRETLRKLAPGSIHCVVTSPPYWNLRDYGVDRQIGLEASPAAYIKTLVNVFRLVRRALRDDGTCWVNMGDSYANDAKWGGSTGGKHVKSLHGNTRIGRSRNVSGLKAKDLVGMPWRLALALQADGWWLRQDIIWAKTNPMPESVGDRCTKAHEYLFLLSKSERYFYDQVAIREPVSTNTHARISKNLANQAKRDTGVGFGHGYDADAKPRVKYAAVDPAWREQHELANIPAGWATGTDRKHRDLTGNFSEARKTLHDRRAAVAAGIKNNASMDAALAVMPDFRNKRSVWTLNTEAFKGAHFATFPTALVEPCIKAGTSEKGVCPHCLSPWRRISIGWGPMCCCKTHTPIPATVLDPFGGAGTTGLVADRLGRDAVLLELNEQYVDMARNRINREAPLFEAAE